MSFDTRNAPPRGPRQTLSDSRDGDFRDDPYRSDYHSRRTSERRMDPRDPSRNKHFAEAVEPSHSRRSTARADLPSPNHPRHGSRITHEREAIENSQDMMTSKTNAEKTPRKKQSLARLNVADMLSNFATSITHNATLKVHIEANKKEKASHDKQCDRQRRYPTKFSQLIESAGQKDVTIRQIADDQDKKRVRNKTALTQLATTLGSRISPAESQAATSSNDAFVPRTSTDGRSSKMLENLRSELMDVRIILDDVRRENDHFQDNAVMQRHFDSQTQDFASKKALFAMEKKTAENAVSVSKCRDEITNLPTVLARTAELSVEIGQLRDGLDKVVTNLENKDGSDKQLQAEQSSLKIGLLDQDQKFKHLQSFVCGNADSDEKGLDTLIEENSNQLNVLKMGLETLQHRFNESRHESSGMHMNVQAAPKELGPESKATFDGKDLEAKFETALSGALESWRDHQRSMVATVTATVGELQAMVEKQGEEISQMKASKTREPRHAGPSLTPTQSTSDTLLRSGGSISIKIQQLETELHQYQGNLTALGTFVQTQQQKFDGLTTQKLTQNMIGYMQQMYPFHPGNFLRELNEHTASLNSQSASLGDLTTRLQRVDQYLATHLASKLKSLEEGITTNEKDSQDLYAGLRDLKMDLSKKVDLVVKDSKRLEGAVHDAEKARVDSITSQEKNIVALDTKFTDRLKQTENYAMMKALEAQSDVDVLKSAYIASIAQSVEGPRESVPGSSKNNDAFKAGNINNAEDQEDADPRTWEITRSSPRKDCSAEPVAKKRKMTVISSDEEEIPRTPVERAFQHNGRPTGGGERLSKYSRVESRRKNVSKGGYL